jgi:rubrerythrin
LNGHDAELRESIEVAIYREIGARDFYRRISEQIKNSEGAQKFAQLSEDEEGHRVKLEAWLERLVGGSFSAEKERLEQSEIHGIKLDEQTGALEALNLAIDAEAKDREFYAERAEKTDIPELKELFTHLSEEEAGHFNLLEAERNAIIGGFYWFDMDSTSFLED